MKRSCLPFRWSPLNRLETRHPKLVAFAVGSLYLVGLAAIGVLLLLYVLSFSLPKLTELEKPQYDLPTQVFDRNGALVTEFYTKRRVLIPYNELPPVATHALISIEDSRFYQHYGIDLIRMTKALIIDVIKMDFAQGASTLTQQTAKMFLLSSEKKIIRKIKEVLLAIQIESRFSKNQILELYLNKAYFGHGAYGIEAAAQGYFSKSARDLNLEEAALLAGLPQAPSRWAPTVSLKNAMRRRNLVLSAMRDQNYITENQYQESKAKPIRLNLGKTSDSNEASYYTELVRRILLDLYGMDTLYTGGLKVYTFMDLKMQIAAQHSLSDGLINHDHRSGYRGASRNLWREAVSKSEVSETLFSETSGLDSKKMDRLGDEDKARVLEVYQNLIDLLQKKNKFLLGGHVFGVVNQVSNKEAVIDLGSEKVGTLRLDDHQWARPVDRESLLNWKTRLKNLKTILKTGDVVEVILDDISPGSQGFALKLYQSPGANGGLISLKPESGEVLAMSGGYDFALSEYNRAIQAKRQPGSAFKPIVYSLALESSFTRATMLDDTPLVFKDTQWRPGNFSKKFKGKISLKNALAHSKNIPTVRLSMALGVAKIIKHARKLGITADLPTDLTIGLGTASVTLKEMARTYSIFANGGNLIEPRFIRRIESKNGKVLLDQESFQSKQVMNAETAFLMTATLQDVVQHGSGFRAKALERPAAGKTGTTNNYTDAWFIGFVPQVLTGVYVGYDDTQKSLGTLETGSRASAPIWVQYMKQVLKTLPVLPFKQPEGIQMVKIVPESGLLDCDHNKRAQFEYFRAGTQPVQCHQNTGYSDTYEPQEQKQNDDAATPKPEPLDRARSSAIEQSSPDSLDNDMEEL